jgi:hypothetical protein
LGITYIIYITYYLINSLLLFLLKAFYALVILSLLAYIQIRKGFLTKRKLVKLRKIGQTSCQETIGEVAGIPGWLVDGLPSTLPCSGEKTYYLSWTRAHIRLTCHSKSHG